MILADDVGMAIANWLNAGGVVGALVLVLVLWFRGYLVRGVDKDQAVAAKDQAIAELKEAHRRELAVVVAERDHLKVELEMVWKAQVDEAEARREAERAADRGAGRDELMLGMLAAIRGLAGSSQ